MDNLSLNDLLENMPQDFSVPEDEKTDFFIGDKNALIQLRKARWLYIKLGEFLNYNIAAASSEKVRKKIYYEKVDYMHIEKNKYICKQIAEIYAKALNLIGVDAVTIELAQGYDVNHVGTIIELCSGQQIYTDLTLDLKNIKTGMKTQQFGYNFPMAWKIQNNFGHNPEDWEVRSLVNCEYLTDDDIEKYLDLPVVGYKKCGMYTDEYLKLFFKELSDNERVSKYILQHKKMPQSEEEKLEYILRYKFEFLLQNLDLENLDYMIGRDYLMTAIDSVFVHEEKRKFHWFNINRKNRWKKEYKDFATCFIINNPSGNLYYIYKGKEIPTLLRKNEFKSKILSERWILPKKDKLSKEIIEPEILEIYDQEEYNQVLE